MSDSNDSGIHRMLEELRSEPFTDEQRDDIKTAMKEAIREWLDDQFATFGRWSILSLAALGLAALAWFILAHSGWSPPGTGK